MFVYTIDNKRQSIYGIKIHAVIILFVIFLSLSLISFYNCLSTASNK